MPIEILSPIAAAFGGAILGAYLSYKAGIKLIQQTHENAIELFHRQEFNKAAATFQAALVDRIFLIRRGLDFIHERVGEDRDDIAIADEKAKIIFEAFLPDEMKRSFNAAWDKYINPDETNKKVYNPLNPDDMKELGDIYLSHIYALLDYAKFK